ncbi:extracellular solute-binding protein [Brevibacillus dissolubilis]|uniref:extracellular solute-binding protein n=1 Tax=Brevibacillus dissolubilis TaxID=1844116 RepID=UPI00111693E3|nr:extracellular solute-binding protein [Brevibacillus dissolubilis]
MNMKKTFNVVATMALFGSILAGCGSNGAAPAAEQGGEQAAGGPVKVTFWSTMNPEETVTMKEIIGEFEKANPDIKVQLETIPFEGAQNKFRTAAQAGNGPDILRSEIAWTPEFAALGLLEPLDNYFKDQDDFLDAPLRYSKWNDKTWSVPQVTDALALLYNKKLLADAGFNEPPKTMEEFRTVAKALSKPAEDKWGFYYRVTDAYWFQPFMWAFGGGLIDDNKEILINTPGSVKGLEFLKELRDVDKVFPNEFDATNEYSNQMKAFQTGRAAMVLNGPWATADILKGEQFKDQNNFGIAPIPAGPEGKTGSPVGGHGYVIYAGSKVKDASYKVIEFINAKENQAKFAVRNGLLPTRKSAYELDDVKSNRIISDYKPVIENATNRPVIPEGGQIYTAFTPEFQAFFKGEKSAQQALDSVAQAWAQLLKK